MSAVEARAIRQLLRRIDAEGGWAHRDAADTLEVLADALAERGYTDTAEMVLHAARGARGGVITSSDLQSHSAALAAVARIGRGLTPPEPNRRRLERLYGYYRQRGQTPELAVGRARLALRHGRVIALVGAGDHRRWPWEQDLSVDALVRNPSGRYVLEHAEPIDEGRHYLLYSVPLERESSPDWLDHHLRLMANAGGISASILRRRWRSKNPRQRAWAVQLAARVLGWANFDYIPRRFTRDELSLRYRRRYR